MENETYQKIREWAQAELQEEVTVRKEVHGDRSDVFKIHTSQEHYFLKIGHDLTKEYERLNWLQDKLPVPKVIAFKKMSSKEALLLSEIPGKNLKVLSKEWPAEKVVTKLAEVLKAFHDTPIQGWPFGVVENESVLIHGDACLPNFIFGEDTFSGYIDLGDVALGNRETDFAAAIWSLQYNLGKGYGGLFLEKYGMTDVTKEMVENLRLQYEDMQKEWGLL